MGNFNKKTIRDINLAGKRVLLRADYNVPLKENQILNDFRIRQSIPTIKYILDQKPAALLIISHLGRPDGKPNPNLSLLPVAKHLGQLLGKKVEFAGDCVSDEAKKAAGQLGPNGILLLENLRFHEGEERNDPDFAKATVEATSADLFVQDGFGVVHRAHASTAAITNLLPSVAGLLLEKEVDVITKAMQAPQRPFVAIIGGAKIGDKIEVLNRFIEITDGLAVAGALANNFLVAEGIEVGSSLVEPEAMPEARQILRRARSEEKRRDFNFFVPVDAVVSKSMNGQLPTRLVDITSYSLADIEAYPKKPKLSSYSVGREEKILDIGPISAAQIAGMVKMAKTVVWGGTCGATEVKGLAGAQAPFAHGTRLVVEAMIGPSNNHKNKPFSIVSGGDTVAYIEAEGLADDFSHISTGGSASLDLMAGKKLPGIEALADK
ncbi:phosphoglycerate kinase [Candidatus Saccharibacteria bacterium]|nr:phosphoglycerate kinase [Candidatus Saccharibacteria bacterium]